MEYAVKVHHPNLGMVGKKNDEPQEVNVTLPPIYDDEGNEESPFLSFNAVNGRTVHLELTPKQADLLRGSYGFEVTSVAHQRAAKTREEGGET